MQIFNNSVRKKRCRKKSLYRRLSPSLLRYVVHVGTHIPCVIDCFLCYYGFCCSCSIVGKAEESPYFPKGVIIIFIAPLLAQQSFKKAVGKMKIQSSSVLRCYCHFTSLKIKRKLFEISCYKHRANRLFMILSERCEQRN